MSRKQETVTVKGWPEGKMAKAVEFLKQNPEANLFITDKKAHDQFPEDLKPRVRVVSQEELFRRW